MCGRFTAMYTWADIHRLSNLLGMSEVQPEGGVADAPARYNIAPTQPIVTVRSTDKGFRASLMRWGLVPSWAKDLDKLPLMFNARAETILEKPAFRGSARHHRCIVPASGYYEWQKTQDGKVPHYITGATGEILLFAGLWDTWLGPTGEEFDSVTIVTVPAGEGMEHLHDRMPAVLTGDAVAAWLDVTGTDAKAAQALLHPAQQGEMAFYPVSTRVNSNRNDGPDLIEPANQDKPSKKPERPKKTGTDDGQMDLF